MGRPFHLKVALVLAKATSAAPIRSASPSDEAGAVAAAALADVAGPARRVAKVAVTISAFALTCVTYHSKPPAVPQEPLLEVIVSVSRADG
jgi:hypothetical protein